MPLVSGRSTSCQPRPRLTLNRPEQISNRLGLGLAECGRAREQVRALVRTAAGAAKVHVVVAIEVDAVAVVGLAEAPRAACRRPPILTPQPVRGPRVLVA